MSNLTELTGHGRLPIFEQLARGESILNPHASEWRPSLPKLGPSVYDLTTPQVRAEIANVMNRIRALHAQGKDAGQLIKIQEALHEVLRSRGERITGSGPRIVRSDAQIAAALANASTKKTCGPNQRMVNGECVVING